MPGEGGTPGSLETVAREQDDSLQCWQGLEQRLALVPIRRPDRRSELPVDHRKERVQIGRGRKPFDERPEPAQGLLQIQQGWFVQEEQRLLAQHREVALEKDVGEKVRLRQYARSQPFDELPVFLRILTFDDGHDILLGAEFAAQFEEEPVIALVGADQVVTTGAELEVLLAVNDAHHRQHELGPDEPARVAHNCLRHRPQQAQHQRWMGGVHQPSPRRTDPAWSHLACT